MSLMPPNPNEPPKKRRWQISLRWFLVGTVTCGVLASVLVRFAIDRIWPPTPESLHNEFVKTNPASLDGWEIVPASEGHLGLTWLKGGISYCDRNEDGIPDAKYRYDPILSTTRVWWEDSDYDGKFDTEVSQGCFHKTETPLPRNIKVPSVSQ